MDYDEATALAARIRREDIDVDVIGVNKSPGINNYYVSCRDLTTGYQVLVLDEDDWTECLNVRRAKVR